MSNVMMCLSQRILRWTVINCRLTFWLGCGRFKSYLSHAKPYDIRIIWHAYGFTELAGSGEEIKMSNQSGHDNEFSQN